MSSIKKYIWILALSFLSLAGSAQSGNQAFIRLTHPLKERVEVSASRNFIIGSTCKTCSVTINDTVVKVYPTGAFVYELQVKPGESSFIIQAQGLNGKKVSKKLNYFYVIPKEPKPVDSLHIEWVKTYPEGNLILKPGDAIAFKVKAKPGCLVSLPNSQYLFELPQTQTDGMPGIYQGVYRITVTDSFSSYKIPVTLTDSVGNTRQKETAVSFSVMSMLASEVGITKGRLAHLEYGLGEDRLGGAKMGYIDSMIRLQITGKFGNKYRVQLAPSLVAYIPEEHLEVMPRGTFFPTSLTGKWKVSGDSVYDRVSIQLFQRLPYQVKLLSHPSRVEVDVFGATNNTNWIEQLGTEKEISRVAYEQVADGMYRIILYLKHNQHWGEQVYYEGTQLVIKVKQQPRDLSLQHLTIAVDAGHGGTNTGAVGALGIAEKDITIALSLKLRELLQKKGAKVIMTRNKEQFFDNKERILFYRDSLPDLLLSIHLNSSADPLRAMGTSTFYRHEGFRSLSQALYKRMLELGLPAYGNNGSFNFMLNSATEYPNALIETLFLSHPEEEMKILDDSFQQLLVEKLVLGLEDFIESCKRND